MKNVFGFLAWTGSIGGLFNSHPNVSFFPEDVPLPTLPNIDLLVSVNVPSVDIIYDKLEPAYITLKESMFENFESVNNAVDGVKKLAITHLKAYNLGILPDDYNPPKYIGPSKNITNIDDETELHHNITKVR
jgi:hypothetical protein